MIFIPSLHSCFLYKYQSDDVKCDGFLISDGGCAENGFERAGVADNEAYGCRKCDVDYCIECIKRLQDKEEKKEEIKVFPNEK